MTPQEILARMQAAHAAFHEAEYQVMVAERTRLRQFAAVTCTCRPWYAWRGGPPQPGCPLHGNVTITFDGQVL